MEQPDAEPIHHHHTGRPWLDMILGVSAVLISFISLFLAVHNGRAMERLVEANSWPFVQIYYSNFDTDGKPHIHLDVANKGVGPAKVESLELLLDGKPMNDARQLLNTILNRVTVVNHPPIFTSDLVHGVISARETMTFVDFKPVQEYSPEDYAAIRTSLEKLRITACYCSVFDECWVADTDQTRPTKVKTCPASLHPFQ